MYKTLILGTFNAQVHLALKTLILFRYYPPIIEEGKETQKSFAQCHTARAPTKSVTVDELIVSHIHHRYQMSLCCRHMHTNLGG